MLTVIDEFGVAHRFDDAIVEETHDGRLRIETGEGDVLAEFLRWSAWKRQ